MSKAEMSGITYAMIHLDAVQTEARVVAHEKATPVALEIEGTIWTPPSHEELLAWRKDRNGEVRYMGQLSWSEKEAEAAALDTRTDEISIWETQEAEVNPLL